MSLDARSRERLEALGRTLPTRLPLPAPSPPAAAPSPAPPPAPLQAGRDTAPSPRHRLETEQDPEALFHALIQASPDGTVPPHHLERLRSLEQQRQPGSATPPPSSAAAPAAATPPARARRGRSGAGSASAPRRLDGPELDLYAAFEDLLQLQEDDGAPTAPPPPRLPPDERLLPRPTLRARPIRP